jgi:hypothetical protein
VCVCGLQERLFPDTITTADVVSIHDRFRRLQTENQIKKLAADLELKVRAIYFDRIRPDAVEGGRSCSEYGILPRLTCRRVCGGDVGIIKSVFQHVVKLEDVKFLLFFAKDLFPANPGDITGEAVLAALVVRSPTCVFIHHCIVHARVGVQALRAKRKAERDAAVAMLVKAMQNLYSDVEPSAVETAAQAIAKQFKSVEEIKQVAADAVTLLPTGREGARKVLSACVFSSLLGLR